MRHITAALGLLLLIPTSGVSAEPRVDENGSTHLPAYVLPESSLLGEASRKALQADRALGKQQEAAPDPCPSAEKADAAHMPAIRECEVQAFYRSAAYRHLYELYPAVMTPKQLGNVRVEIFEPKAGVAPENLQRVLINVHGGGFEAGARTASHLESVPIAVVGRIKIVSIDYRQAPEHVFPAASEDVEAVYRELLKTYQPGNIGIYGCSAGGLLTAQSVAWFQKKQLPMPGAIGMLCEGGVYWTEGDSGATGDTFGWGSHSDAADRNPYFKGVKADDALAFPARSLQVLARFPPSLLVSGSRDVALSSVLYTHSRLVEAGVEADLHVWEGMGHGFYMNPDLPESRQVYSVIVRFFSSHLGR